MFLVVFELAQSMKLYNTIYLMNEHEDGKLDRPTEKRHNMALLDQHGISSGTKSRLRPSQLFSPLDAALCHSAFSSWALP